MKGFDNYIDGLDEGLDFVLEAISEGDVTLTREELFDFTFKAELNSLYYYCKEYKTSLGKLISNKDVRLAKFFAKKFNSLVELVDKGFSYRSAVWFANSIIIEATLLGLNNGNTRIKTNDNNGILYISVNGEEESDSSENPVLAINSSKTFFESMIVLLTYVGVTGRKEGEFREFLSEYLISVYTEIRCSRNPKPHIYKGKAKTLCNYAIKKNISETSKESEKIIAFKIV